MCKNSYICKYRILPAVLLLLGVATSCGRNLGNIQVQGNPTLTVTVDTGKLVAFFNPYCAQLLIAQGIPNPSEANVTACTNAMVGNFLAETQGEPTLPLPSPLPQ